MARLGAAAAGVPSIPAGFLESLENMRDQRRRRAGDKPSKPVLRKKTAGAAPISYEQVRSDRHISGPLRG